MNDAVESLSAAMGVAIVFGIPFGFFAFVRYLRYKETIALAEQGLLLPERSRRNRDTLKWGIVIMMLGLGLSCGVIPLGFLADNFNIVPWLIIGILPFFFGLSLIMVYLVNNKLDEEEDARDEDAIPAHKRFESGNDV
jgi:hypothetical protein